MLKNNGFHNRHSPVLRTFSPLSLFASGAPGAWYDPSDFSTLFQDSAGTTPVTAVDQPVGRILDKSGNGSHAIQATTLSCPLLKIDGNGKYYLLFDGINDSLSTSNVNFTSTDEMSAFVGLRKLSDAAIGMVVETGPNAGSGNAIQIRAPGTVGSTYMWGSGGTAPSFLTPSGYVAPITNTITGISDISGDSAIMRINGAQVAISTADSGSGTYGNYPIHIGRRGGASLPFNGRLYSLILVGKVVSASELTNTEAWVNEKTGAY